MVSPYTKQVHSEEKLDEQQKFLYDIISQIDDCMCDAEFDLGPESVLYLKLKDLLETVENYQESL